MDSQTRVQPTIKAGSNRLRNNTKAGGKKLSKRCNLEMKDKTIHRLMRTLREWLSQKDRVVQIRTHLFIQDFTNRLLQDKDLSRDKTLRFSKIREWIKIRVLFIIQDRSYFHNQPRIETLFEADLILGDRRIVPINHSTFLIKIHPWDQIIKTQEVNYS